VIGSDTALGTGTLWINSGGSLSAIGARQIANPVVFGPGTLTTSGDPLTFSGTVLSTGLTIAVNGGTARFTGPFTSFTLRKTGPGLLRCNPLTTQILTVDTAVMQIDGSVEATLIRGLNVSAGATLDLTNGAMVLNYSGSSPATTIRTALTSGFAAGAWTGTGIASSTAATVALDGSNPHKTGVGFAEASAIGITSLGGQALDSTSLLVRYTLYGDANLDGAVNALDFGALAGHFGQSSATWGIGDFNYDGVVNGLDFNALAGNFGFSLPAAAGSSQLLPEPIAILPLLATGLHSRRRQNDARASDFRKA
jgi:hypothetical protein